MYDDNTFDYVFVIRIFEEKELKNFHIFMRKSAKKKIEVSKFSKGMSGRAENLHIDLTFCALSNSKLSFQRQKFSATDLGGDLVDALLI